MNIFLLALLGNLIIAIWIIITLFVVKLLKNKLLKYLDYITATTVWLLLWIIFIWFIPEIVDSELSWENVWIFILFWLFIFYIFELFLHWHHCQDLSHKNHSCNKKHYHKEKNWVLMFGSTLLHNAFHWVVLFWAFWVNTTFWVTTTVAILLHSIPQNIVNYIMNHNKDKYSYVAAFWWILWALLTYPFAKILLENKFIILSLIAWGLLYTALADILPEFKDKGKMKSKIIYLFFIVFWIILFLLFE